jgi:quinol monooxygenase YgiN
MGYVQIIEFKTSRFDEVEALHEKWLAETAGERTTLSEHICRDRDQPDTYVLIVEFPSYEDAMKNNDLPATARIAEGMAALADAPLTFRNLDVIRVD